MKSNLDLHAAFLAVLTLALLVFAAVTAFAEPPAGMHPSPQMHQWFESLRSPAGMSCCGVADCRFLDVKRDSKSDSGFDVRIGDEWVRVPQRVVNLRTDNPTGRFVTCVYPGVGIDGPAPKGDSTDIICFIEPPMA